MVDESNIEQPAVHGEAISDKMTRKPAASKSKDKASPAKAPAGRSAVRHSQEEKTAKLNRIETLIRERKTTLKDAVRDVGIGEQTYYNWKKAAGAQVVMQPSNEALSDDLEDLVKLEEENLRLRKNLAEKLRSENAVLRKRLGLD
jgi:putative transposase